MCGSETRPSVLWDNLTALRPKTLEEAQVALFIRKLPCHISAMINTKSFDTPKDMIRRCNQLWATQCGYLYIIIYTKNSYMYLSINSRR